MKLRPEIKAIARANFTAQYGTSVGGLLIVILITSALSMAYAAFNGLMLSVNAVTNHIVFNPGLFLVNQISLVLSIFLYPPLMVGYNSFTLSIYRGGEADIGSIFSDGFANYWRKVGGMLWMYLFTFLWSLLLVIPGIVKALSYFMTPYILAESKNVTATDALKLSMRMTQGYKGEIFVMALSFIGWTILTGLTGGLLGIFYTGPYIYTSFAGLYDELKRNAIAKGVVSIEDLA